jgi:hypothetical protein
MKKIITYFKNILNEIGFYLVIESYYNDIDNYVKVEYSISTYNDKKYNCDLLNGIYIYFKIEYNFTNPLSNFSEANSIEFYDININRKINIKRFRKIKDAYHIIRDSYNKVTKFPGVNKGEFASIENVYNNNEKIFKCIFYYKSEYYLSRIVVNDTKKICEMESRIITNEEFLNCINGTSPEYKETGRIKVEDVIKLFSDTFEKLSGLKQKLFGGYKV